jgi:hypothetical protein
MQIIGFNLTKILVEREEKIEGKLEVKQNIDIAEVSKEKIPFSDNEAIKINFNFIVNYEPEFAKLILEGYLVILVDKDEMKKFLKAWKNKKLPEPTNISLFNFIMNKCNIKALNLEDELNLPFHVPMPKINPSNMQQQS